MQHIVILMVTSCFLETNVFLCIFILACVSPAFVREIVSLKFWLGKVVDVLLPIVYFYFYLFLCIYICIKLIYKVCSFEKYMWQILFLLKKHLQVI